MKFIIEAPSARFGLGNCLLGEGDTESAAWADAFGPKPWSPSQKKSARNAWCRQVKEDELRDLEERRAND